MKKYDIIKKWIAVLGIVFLLTPASVFGQAGGLVPCGQKYENGQLTGEVCTLSHALEMAINVINLALQFSAFFAVAVIMNYGYKMIDAGVDGDAEMYETGKKGIGMAVMGMFFIIMAYAVVNGIWGLLFPASSGYDYGTTWFKPWQ